VDKKQKLIRENQGISKEVGEKEKMRLRSRLCFLAQEYRDKEKKRMTRS